MCKLFINADPQLWQTRLKSLRLAGFSTSVRLENLYWQVLEEIAKRDGMSLPQLLAKLHGELLEERGEVENFSSFLRVCCGRYLLLQLAGDIPRDLGYAVRDLDADVILARESERLARSRSASLPTRHRPAPHLARAAEHMRDGAVRDEDGRRVGLVKLPG